MKGSDAIADYWQEGAVDAQENVKFSSLVWAINGMTAVAGWQASFARIPSGVQVKLDGTFKLTFSAEQDELRCESFKEW